MTDPILELKHIKKSFRHHCILNDVSIKVFPKDILCMAGPSGLGKTTILEIMAGILKADSGKRICHAERIGYAFQDDCLLNWRNLRENIEFALDTYEPDQSRREETARHWLKTLNLIDSENKKPTEISGGMKRRLNIARALAVKPDILMLDEPFAFLDQENCNLLISLLKKLNKDGMTIIFVSHTHSHSEQLGAETIIFDSSPINFL